MGGKIDTGQSGGTTMNPRRALWVKKCKKYARLEKRKGWALKEAGMSHPQDDEDVSSFPSSMARMHLIWRTLSSSTSKSEMCRRRSGF